MVMHPPPSPAEAYYAQRHAVARTSERLRALRDTIDDPVNLSRPQWAQWFAYAREYRPDLIIELGRGNGNSTATFSEALHQNGHGKLVSFCINTTWQDETVAKLAPLVEADWFDRIDARVGDLCQVDFGEVLGEARRVLLLWDAHGMTIAETVLGHIMPRLQDREHMVIMHDISDLRYCGSPRAYGDGGLWQGGEWVSRNGRYDCRLQLGWIDTVVDQPIAALDFLGRNGAELQSADHTFHQEIAQNPERLQEMEKILGEEDLSMLAHWAWFSLNAVEGPYTFPRLSRRPASL